MKRIPYLLAIGIAGCYSSNGTVAKPPEKGPEPVVEATQPDPKPSPNIQEPVGYQRIYDLKSLERTTLAVNEKKIQVWIADDDGKRTEGMMSLTEKDVKDDEGMLFVFSDARPLSFWMQNTVLPLDIVYIGSNGKVLNVQKGEPFNEKGLPSEGDGQYVLELKQGMADRFAIKKGTQVQIPSSVKAKD